MTNKEKEQYLSDQVTYKSVNFVSEIERKKLFLSKMPQILYKYRAFDKYAYEMLEEPYIYLSPATELDDPFDCLTFSGLKRGGKTKNEPDLELIKFVIRCVEKRGNVKFDKSKILQLVRSSIKNGEVDEKRAELAFKEYTGNDKESVGMFFVVLLNLMKCLDNIVPDEKLGKVIDLTLKNPNKIGICSLTTKRDNKVMWSTYADEYKGYCVEYVIPEIDDIRFNLCPVIYNRYADNNLIHKIIDFHISALVREMSHGALNNGIGSMNELFCTKDSDWEYQDEWRLLGNATDHNKLLKIKAVYLGFKVSDYKTNKIKKFAKLNEYSVYKMNPPSGKKKITYKKII